MHDPTARLLWAFLPLILLWLGISGLMAAVALRLAPGSPDDGTEVVPEVWVIIAGSGAAVGGFLGLGSTAPTSLQAIAQLTVGRSLVAAAVGMLLGAAGAVWLGLAAFALWHDRR
ncbi:MAG TPA: hypothetical protein VFS08_08345 [Gemmatimonadaceae bacterium]|nr:hypothetical protein [Gemmatimonadaceae bacterium]